MSPLQAVIFFSSLTGAAILIWLLSVISAAINNGDANNAADTGDEHGAPNNLQQQAQRQVGVATITNAINAYRRTRKSEERKRAKREKITIAVLGATAFFALIAAGAAIVSAWVFEGQLDEMRIEQRPWLSLNVVASHLEVVQDRIGGPYISLFATAINVGKSPAEDVTFRVITHVPKGPEQGSFSDFAKAECGRMTMRDFAPLLVPGEEIKQNLLVLFTRQQILDAWAGANQKGRKLFIALPIICVLYHIPTDAKAHLMAAVTEVERSSPGSPAMFDILGKYGD